MESSPSILALAILTSLLIYKFIILPVFFSPLSRLPAAHPLSYITEKYSQYLAWREQEFDWILHAHRRHGPLIRTGPSSVNVNSVEGLRQTYISLEKHAFYAQFTSYKGIPNMFSMPDSKNHGAQKRILSGVYSKSYLQRSDDMRIISGAVLDERLLPLMEHLADTKRNINIFQLFHFVGTEFQSAYAFGLDNIRPLIERHGHENYAYQTADPNKIYDSRDKRDHDWYSEDECLALCKTSAAQLDEKMAPTSSSPIIFAKLYANLLAKNPNDKEQVILHCASEIRDEIIAAHEGIAIVLTYAFYHLSKRPSLQQRLREELATSTSPNPDEIPLLNAILTETLRLNAPGAGRQPRLSPPAGMTLHGHYIPPGTSISSSAYVLHRNEDVFPNADSFVPERWLDANDEMKKWWWAFGSGGRMCIGNHFALMILYGVLAKVYGGGLETWVVDDEGIEQMKVFLAGPRGRRLVLGVGRVERMES